MPALEHNNKVIGESLDLIKYVDSNFGGPSLWPKVRFVKFVCAVDGDSCPFSAFLTKVML